ncbi:MAG: hypothetical protein JWO94_2186 [Verrucomicrobiaceae bacterium]|nr:hypothetical protein [Verrucomicrobiaceae bacterium]
MKYLSTTLALVFAASTAIPANAAKMKAEAKFVIRPEKIAFVRGFVESR